MSCVQVQDVQCPSLSHRGNFPEIVPAQQTKRAKRTPGGNAYVDNPKFRDFIDKLRSNDWQLGDLHGRILKLKRYVSPDASPAQLDMIIECLKLNVRVEVLYIQNFEKVTVPLSPIPASPSAHCAHTPTLTFERSKHQRWKDVSLRDVNLRHDYVSVSCNSS
jgi:hypothetical protein